MQCFRQDGLYRIQGDKGFHSQVNYETMTKNKDELTCTQCSVFSKGLSQLDPALEWHNNKGHPHTKRYLKLANTFNFVAKFPRQVLEEIFCVPCRLAKIQHRTIHSSIRVTCRLLELIHVEIADKINTASLSSRCYGVGFIDDLTLKSDVYFLKTKAGLYLPLKYYKERAEAEIGKKTFKHTPWWSWEKCVKHDPGVCTSERYSSRTISSLCTREQRFCSSIYGRTWSSCKGIAVRSKTCRWDVGRINASLLFSQPK